MRFLNIVRFSYIKYVVKNLGLFVVLFVLRCEMITKKLFSERIYFGSTDREKFEKQQMNALTINMFKYSYCKDLGNPIFVLCSYVFAFVSFFAFWRDENAFSELRSL